MDGGDVIPNLDEPWTLAGASLMDWCAGVGAAITTIELFHLTPARSMPVLIAVLLGVTLGLAALKRRFPDRDRGVMNYVVVRLGFSPPGIPAPADFQPIWSAAPLKEFPEGKEFRELGLIDLFAVSSDDSEDEDEGFGF